MSRSHIATPSELLSLRDLELATRTTVEGLRQGLHRSPFHGYSAEFSQYRHYRPGDDLKYVDWKAFGRTDRLYTRQFRETTNMAALFVIDVSRSMDYPGHQAGTSVSRLPTLDSRLSAVAARWPAGAAMADKPTPDSRDATPARASKFALARAIAAVLGTLVLDQGDAAGLLAGDEPATYVAPRSGHHHLRVFLAKLAGLAPAGAATVAASIRTAAGLLKRRGLVVVLSDFYEEHESLAEVKRLARMGHDVVAIHTLAAEELALPADGAAEFEDLETGRTLIVDPEAVRAEYAEAVRRWLGQVERELAGAGLDYLRITTADPLDAVLRRFLVARRRAA